MSSSNGLTKITASLVLVGTITAGVVWMETRYAKAADLKELRKEQQQATREVKVLILENARESARARVFELEQVGKLRHLLPEEARRATELRDEITDLTDRIGRLEAQGIRP